ncbi:major facilitator superfamily MFS_1 [Xylanimonas cellulosilytica DSM 15894]|uniref:Major facilitator superfamily MFS_1 n=1 Tax=Xylanimonas cellulosilytica (strain DSM 15894 / JCM 12276 / CECT 5975 / KCTC 9989 / LMG 20990 / NBRC 107835 / XIL07) TaxID=446471 RepID=D1BYJ0_XYLCX|nr:MFS transporter [Xylanimonas cellulosilytica]ACZ31862.1 major facilitator superfamily MFS_1 [Xylanimonas cellulosilytica DSM 15894]
MASTFSSLRYPNYRIWFGAALVANIGTWMQRVGQDWVVLTQLTDNSGTAVGITTALQFLPFLLLSPYAGLLADRLDRRKLLMTTQAMMGVLALVLAALTLTDTVQLWHLYTLALLLGVASAIDSPVRQTFVAALVPQDKLPNAIGLNSASFNAARLIGPGVAGLLVAAVGAGWVFLINGVSFAATIVALALMNTATLRVLPTATRSKGQIREAVRFVRGRSDIVVIMAVMAVVSMFGLNFQLTSALMARVEFGKGPGEYGVLGSVLAVGSLAGALLAARRDRPRVRLVLGAGFAFAAATTLNALMPSFLMFALTSIPVGLASLTMITAANATLQTSVDPVMRGRVMALYMMVFLGATPVGAPIVGWIGEVAGPRWAILSGSIATFLVVGAAAVWAVRNWKFRIEPHLRPWPRLDIVYPTTTVGAAA